MSVAGSLQSLRSTSSTTSDASPFRTAVRNIIAACRSSPVALATYCQAYGRWVEAERRLAETPPLLKTPAGYVQASPWIAISNKQVELMTRLMGELGLSPSARSRLAVQIPSGPKPWEF